MRSRCLLLAVCLAAAVPASPARASENLKVGGVRFDLFGGWAYGKTGEHSYLDATEDGEAENVNLALSARRDFSKKLRLVAQAEASRVPGESEIELDYLFLDWRPTAATTWRFGRSKQPFGIYAEFYDLGTDRPFYDLPQGLYGPTEIVAENFDGIAFQYRHELTTSELRLDAYAGKIRFSATEPWEPSAEGENGEGEVLLEEEDIDRNDTVGFRLEWQQRNGLTLGVSAFRGNDNHAGDLGNFGAAVGGGVHLMWDSGEWLVRAEAARFEESENQEVEAAYLEVARHFGPHWQAAARWDRSTTLVDEADLEELGATLGEHRDVAVGLNYWFSPNLVLKLSNHWVEGHRFLSRDEIGDLERNYTRMIRFGVQFLY